MILLFSFFLKKRKENTNSIFKKNKKINMKRFFLIYDKRW